MEVMYISCPNCNSFRVIQIGGVSREVKFTPVGVVFMESANFFCKECKIKFPAEWDKNERKNVK